MFASDHAGFDLKTKLIPFVQELGYEVQDLGPISYDAEDDYPELIARAAKQVAEDPKGLKGIVIGGSGQGEAIVANRYPRVRTALYYGGSPKILTLSREHNDANMLSLGARFLTEEEAKCAVQTWLSTDFSGGERHLRRIAQIEAQRHG